MGATCETADGNASNLCCMRAYDGKEELNADSNRARIMSRKSERISMSQQKKRNNAKDGALSVKGRLSAAPVRSGLIEEAKMERWAEKRPDCIKWLKERIQTEIDLAKQNQKKTDKSSA